MYIFTSFGKVTCKFKAFITVVKNSTEVLEIEGVEFKKVENFISIANVPNAASRAATLLIAYLN